jgi:hypothetical protein
MTRRSIRFHACLFGMFRGCFRDTLIALVLLRLMLLRKHERLLLEVNIYADGVAAAAGAGTREIVGVTAGRLTWDTTVQSISSMSIVCPFKHFPAACCSANACVAYVKPSHIHFFVTVPRAAIIPS